MKFYSKIVSKPNSIFEEIRDGFRVVKRIKICVFMDGVFETEDKEIITKLQKRPDLFRSDRPWKQKANWKISEEGKALVLQGEALGIDCRHIRQEFLKKRIYEIQHPEKDKNIPDAPVMVEKKLVGSKAHTQPQIAKIDYKEVMRLAKAKGFKTHKVKQDVLKKQLKESGVNV